MEDQFVGSYKILKKIGAGGMSRVYLAVHQDVPNLKVILKVLGDPRLIERFRQEADKLALLDGHPSICRIKHFFSHGEETVIAMEYIDGITLEEKIQTERRLSVEESLQIVSDVLDILDFAHQKGVFHRDIKPTNIMLDRKGQVKIIDFGIAKAESDPHLTLAGTACGTPAFMAPEQFTPAPDTNYALVDVYAAGTTLFAMLTGECPFKGDNEFAIRDAKLFTDTPKPRSINSEIPRKVEEIILKSLSRDPKMRFQSASEMRTALEAVRGPAGDSVRAARPQMTIDVSEVTPVPSRRRRLPVWTLVGLAALVAATYVAYRIVSWEGTGTGIIEINVAPIGDIFVDDSLIGSNQLSAYPVLAAGQHTIRVTNVKSIEKTLTKTVQLKEDSAAAVSFSFTMPLPMGSVAVSVTPRGDVYCDDRLVAGKAAHALIPCDSGVHVIRVENSKAIPPVLIDTVRVLADQTLSRQYSFYLPPSPDTPAALPPAPKSQDVVVVSKPRGAEVLIDGILQQHRAPFTYRLTVGEHVIAVKTTIDGQEKQQEQTVRVGEPGSEKVTFDLEK
ncbi:MAG TPA: serine/threonine-protein kinase [Candidatus Deferrimicrobium sp.]|nr:serine/threonine-protein kinase [Candidatus Deferrimicrobium sp.]